MNENQKTHHIDCPHCDYEMQFSAADVDEYGEIGCEYCQSDLYVGDICPNLIDDDTEETNATQEAKQ